MLLKAAVGCTLGLQVAVARIGSSSHVVAHRRSSAPQVRRYPSWQSLRSSIEIVDPEDERAFRESSVQSNSRLSGVRSPAR
jgi:hypothetical protein